MEVSRVRSRDKQSGRDTPLPSLPPGQARLVEIEPENLAVSPLKAAEEGNGLIVRVVEMGGRETQGKLTFPRLSIASTREANDLEVAGSALPNAPP